MLIRGRAKPFIFDREYTPHGVVVAVDRERHLAFTIRWSGTEPGAVGALAVLAMDRASSLDDLGTAVARWKTPARRFMYRDRDGHTGSTNAALVPIRRGWNGRLPAPGWSGTNEWIGWQTRPTAGATTTPIVQLARVHPDRADAVLRELVSVASQRDGSARTTPASTLMQQRAILVNALADALRDAAPAPVLFAHVLAISPDARHRFNVGPLTPHGDGPPFAMTFDDADWDRSTAMSAPGQSGSASSGHFVDLARMWAAGEKVTLAFSEAAVHAAGETTLVLVPKKP
jgi:acyl-homoserine lactone acylase PvdQ